MDRRLAERPWFAGDAYAIADIAIFPWVNNLVGFYGAGDLVGISEFTNVRRSPDAFLARPAVVRGLQIPGRDGWTRRVKRRLQRPSPCWCILGEAAG